MKSYEIVPQRNALRSKIRELGTLVKEDPVFLGEYIEDFIERLEETDKTPERYQTAMKLIDEFLTREKASGRYKVEMKCKYDYIMPKKSNPEAVAKTSQSK